MTPLSQRYREKVAFDEEYAGEAALEWFGKQPACSVACSRGVEETIESEAKRRAPIDQAVAELIEAIEQLNDHTEGQIRNRSQEEIEMEYSRLWSNVQNALQKLKEVLG